MDKERIEEPFDEKWGKGVALNDEEMRVQLFFDVFFKGESEFA